jgi:hypothetical protein
MDRAIQVSSSTTARPLPARVERRQGALMAIELLFVLPLLVILSLVAFQFILIHSAYQRVQGAALAATELAACGQPHQAVHDEAGRVLGLLGNEYESELEYLDVNEDHQIDPCVDTVVVAVRIPMGLASTNYLGLLGASVNDLHIRAVVSRTMKQCEGCNGGFGNCVGLVSELIESIRDLEEAGKLNHGDANSLIVKLKEAREALCLCGGDRHEACNRLAAFFHELDTFVPGQGKAKDLSPADLDALRELAIRLKRCLCPDDHA